MNIANAITLSRIPMMFAVAFFLYFYDFRFGASVAFVLFSLACITDWLDGYLARKCKITSTLGAFMDAVTDKIFMLGTQVAMLVAKILPGSAMFLVMIIILREFLITGLRAVAASKNTIIAAEKSGKIKTVFQMVSVILLLLWNALRYDIEVLDARILNSIWDLGILLFFVATVITVVSGTMYIVKYNALLVDL